MDKANKRVTAERCAYLMAVAMANQLFEVWISLNPELLYCYLFQYLPAIAKRYLLFCISAIRSVHYEIVNIQYIKDYFQSCKN